MPYQFVTSVQMEFHRKLRDYRIRARMSQEDLAEFVGVSQAQVSKWERGANVPDFRQAALLARKLGVSLNHMADEERGVLPEVDAETARRVEAMVDAIGFDEAYRRLLQAPIAAVVLTPTVNRPGDVAPARRKGAG